MSYNLNRLGSQNFEHLVQALSKKIIGEGVSIYGAGPDGQREATFHGKAPYPSETECWEGYWVIQAKFKEPNTKKADFPWIKECFEEEMNGFREKQGKGKTIPNNYLFFTNIVLTPVAEKGIKDKIEELAKEYNDLIPNIHIIGADDINRFLDGHRDVAVAYASYILSGDILSYLYNDVQAREKERQNSFLRFLAQTFSDDYCSRMEQAGQVTEDKVSIDKVYVDLDFRNEETGMEEKFIEHAINVGNSVFRFSAIDQRNKDNSLISDFDESNKYVLKGSAGQGKSTVCQFLAQIYRANFLKNFSITPNPKIEEFLNRIEDNSYTPSCLRVPVRIELRLYSAWMIRRKSEEKMYDLVTYISTMIGEKASEKFDNDTLRLYFAKYSWIFFFDGLDEVPESSNRKDVMEEIERFIQVELRQADADAMFFATTRPEGYVGEFNNSKFTHVDLIPLDKDNCFKYVNKLLLAIEDDSTKRKEYLTILEEGWDNHQIDFMMQTPLQATIITILVRAGGEPPRDKYSLFKEFFDIIIKREKQKGMGTILNTNQDLIEGVYHLLGFELQKRSSTTVGSDALISLDYMKQLIQRKLDEDGIDQSSKAYNKMLNDAYHMIVNRINFASEIKEGYIGFSIRSMQEFLAAVYMVKTFSDSDLKIIIKELAKSSYWKNTFNFLVECISKEKTYYLDHIIDTVLSELNGNDIPIGDTNATKSVCYGSQVAFSLLTNNIFKNKPKYENKLCKYVVTYCNLEFVSDVFRVRQVSDNVKNQLVNYLLQKDSLTNADLFMTSILLQDEYTKDALIDLGKKYAVQIVQQFYDRHKRSCPRQLYNLVVVALDQGVVLNLDFAQLADIVKNANEYIQSDKAKETIFKITVRLMLGKRGSIPTKTLQVVCDFFACDIKPLSNLRNYFERPQREITEYLTVMQLVPEIENEQLEGLITLASKYSLPALSLILKTINSRNLDDYLYFFNSVKEYAQEIATYEEQIIIQQNSLLMFLYEKAIFDDTFEMNNEVKSKIKEVLENPPTIQDLNDIIESKPSIVPEYSIMSSGEDAFCDFYSAVKTVYTDEELIEIPELKKTLMFLFSCQYQFEYKNQSDEDDARNDGVEKLNEYLKLLLDSSQKDIEYNIWQNHIRTLAFLVLSKKEWFKYPDMLFPEPKNKRPRKYPSFFAEKDTETIIKNMVSYVSWSENISALEFLIEFILSEMTYEMFVKIDWNSLEDVNSIKTQCLLALSNIKKEQDVEEKLLPLLSDDIANEFVFKLASSMRLPERFLPLYIYYLNKFRQENNTQNVYDLEKTIVSYINIIPVELEGFLIE